MFTVLKTDDDDRDGLLASVEGDQNIFVESHYFAIAQPGESVVLHTLGLYPCTLIAIENVEGAFAFGHFDGSNIFLRNGGRFFTAAVQKMLDALGGHPAEHIVLSGTYHEELHDPWGNCIYTKIDEALAGFDNVEWHREPENVRGAWYDRGYLFTRERILVLYTNDEEGERRPVSRNKSVIHY